jgi:hypothetical protein
MNAIGVPARRRDDELRPSGRNRPGGRAVLCGLLVVVALSSAAIMFFVLWRDGPSRARPSDTSSSSLSPSNQVPLTRGHPGDRKTASSNRPLRMPPWHASATGADTAAAQAETARSLRCIENGNRSFEGLEQCWGAESQDPEWSANVESFVYARLHVDDLERDIVRQVDCRRVLCRIELDAQDVGAILRLGSPDERFQDRLRHKFVSTDGGRSFVIYVVRDELASRVFDAGSSAEQQPLWNPGSGDGGVHDMRSQSTLEQESEGDEVLQR